MERNVNIVKDVDGNKIVIINDIKFRGKRSVNWNDVEEYLKMYIGEIYQIASSNDLIYIGNDLPDEYAHSTYTNILKGANAKAKANAKANASQALPEMLQIAEGKEYSENRKEKHNKDAKYGWYSYESRFAVPVYSEDGELERYNVFRAIILIRHASDHKMYLYDIKQIKKETSNLFQSKDLTQ